MDRILPEDTTLPVNFGMDHKYVFETITSDISTADCILDLIDNSIDAARRNISNQKSVNLKNGLPESYAGYEIILSITKECISISDNCRGMETHLLQNTAFRLGARHKQDFSIGIYGVGLVRAFWKLGDTAKLTTDNGSDAFVLNFTKKDLENGETTLGAEKIASKNIKSNLLEISDLTQEALYDLSDEEWYERLLDRIHRIYGLCIRKGLLIKVDTKVIPAFGPSIRSDISALMGEEEFDTSNGVHVECKIGVHQDYVFKNETSWSQRANASVVPECGWYIVCNDRIVLTADKSVRVGWTSTWHSEYNGMLGWAFFTSEDADLLPWDSTKTDISLEKRSQRETAKKLKELSDKYRSINRNFRYGDDEKGNLLDSNKKEEERKGGKAKKDKNNINERSEKYENKLENKIDKEYSCNHHESWSTLLSVIDIQISDVKLNALIDEAKRIDIKCTYSCALLYRSIIERAIVIKIRNMRKYDDVKEMIFKEACDNGRPYNENQKKGCRPTLREMLDWMDANHDFFNEAERRDCVRSLKNFKNDLKCLNGVFHEGDLIGVDKLKNIRNNGHNLLSYLIKP